MIISVEDVKKYIATNAEDTVLEGKLQALELLIRKYTNNNFQKRSIRAMGHVMTAKIYANTNVFAVGDTIELSESIFSNGIYTIKNIEDGFIEVDGNLLDETDVLVTKVEYPIDVVMGVVNMLKWDLENRDKVGIQSETISRHSVTYFDMNGDNSIMGYPKSLLGFLKPYMKARF